MIRVIAHPDYRTFGVALTVVRQYSDDSTPVEVLHMQAGEGKCIDRATWDQHKPHATYEPTLILEDEIGRALLDALNRHYGGVDDARALRADLDKERARTDKLIGHLADIAASRTGPQP